MGSSRGRDTWPEEKIGLIQHHLIDIAKTKGNGEPPQIIRTAQKGTYVEKYEVLSGEAARQRCLSSFELDALMVVEVDIPVNHLVCLRKRGRFVPVNALCLED